VFFVDSGSGNDVAEQGDNPNLPFATLDYAVGKCTANNGDIIYLMPGHVENVTSATTQVIDVAGLRIIGMGVGATRPTFTYTATSSSFEIDAANTYIENVRFVASVSAVVVGMNFDADGITLMECEFDWDETGDDFLIMIDADAFDYHNIINCNFIAQDATGAAKAIRLDDVKHSIIRGNNFFGDYSDAPISSDTSTAASENIVIADNLIYNSDTAVGAGIRLQVATTGVIANNSIGVLGASAASGIDPGSCLCVENYVVSAIDETGAVIPASAST
jgi:hypothetical protein